MVLLLCARILRTREVSLRLLTIAIACTIPLVLQKELGSENSDWSRLVLKPMIGLIVIWLIYRHSHGSTEQTESNG